MCQGFFHQVQKKVFYPYFLADHTGLPYFVTDDLASVRMALSGLTTPGYRTL
jgi:hypothetical protein